MYKTLALFILFLGANLQSSEGKHLFILSGQSNMQRLNPDVSFIPAVKKAIGKNVIVIKDSHGGHPISRWYKNWVDVKGNKPSRTGDLYDRLMKKVDPAVKGQKLLSVNFIWMQGERDARMNHGDVYTKSFLGLIDQVKSDLEFDNVNFVIGRLSDFGMTHKDYKHWIKVREVQVKLAENHPRGEWVNTDDLNDGKNHRGRMLKNDLHYTPEGYKKLGQRFADKAIALIKKYKK